MKKLTLTLALVALASGTALAQDVYQVVRVERATKTVEFPVQVCQRPGAYSAPVCEHFMNRTEVVSDNYNVYIAKDTNGKQKVFESTQPYPIGTKINITKD